MKERPILFSGPMVRAILAGTKTQTRRIINIDDTPISAAAAKASLHQRGIPSNAVNVRNIGAYLKCDAPLGSATVSSRVVCPYGEPDDRLWVREAFAPRYFDNGRSAYRADWDGRAADVSRGTGRPFDSSQAAPSTNTS